MKKLIGLTSFVSIILGLVMLIGGVWGMCFTYSSVVQENITTPSDASIPEVAVRGPMTLKAQADIIRHHALDTTEGRTYAEMSRDEDRSIWITATSLTTSLHLGIIAYGISAIAIAVGLFMVLVGLVFARKYKHAKK